VIKLDQIELNVDRGDSFLVPDNRLKDQKTTVFEIEAIRARSKRGSGFRIRATDVLGKPFTCTGINGGGEKIRSGFESGETVGSILRVIQMQGGSDIIPYNPRQSGNIIGDGAPMGQEIINSKKRGGENQTNAADEHQQQDQLLLDGGILNREHFENR